MKNNQYYVVLKENITFDSVVVAEKIREMELVAPEDRFPFENERIEVYSSDSKESCNNFIDALDNELKNYFCVLDGTVFG